MFTKLRNFWKSLGPGLITGASDNDPAGITMYALAGARYGYGMAWALLFILPLMIAIQEMSARIGALTGCGLAGNIKKHYPRWLLAGVAVTIVAANTFNVGANIYGMAGALNLLLPIPVQLLALLLSVFVVLLTIFLRYQQMVSIFKWLAMTLFAYMFAFLLVGADWGQLTRYLLIPYIKLDKDFLVMLFAIFGTTISPYLYFWQASEEAEDIRQTNPRIRVCKYHAVSPAKLEKIERDTKIGMVFSNIISFFILALTAATIFRSGDGNIETLRQAAEALRPLAGDYAYLLFTSGLLGAGLLAIPVLAGSAGYVLAEFFGWEASLDKPFTKAREFYIAIIISVTIGLLIPFLGITPIQALFYTGLLNGLISPILILLIIHMSSNPQIVGTNRTRPAFHALGHAAFFIMLVGTVFVFIS